MVSFRRLFLVSLWAATPAAFSSPPDDSVMRNAPEEWLYFGDDAPTRSKPSPNAPACALQARRGTSLPITLKSKDENGDAWLGWGPGEEQHWIPQALAVRLAPENRREGNLDIGAEVVDRWRALPLDYAPDDLAPLPKKFRYDKERDCPLRAEALEQVVSMLRAARKEGVALEVVSAYRAAEKQRSLFLRKIESAGYSQRAVAKPGHSEHQLGVTVDLAGPGERHLLQQSFGQTREGRWLQENAVRFGFTISYTEDNEADTGYQAEPWHFRYVGLEKAGDWKAAGKPER